jgi:hypothetical protein
MAKAVLASVAAFPRFMRLHCLICRQLFSDHADKRLATEFAKTTITSMS